MIIEHLQIILCQKDAVAQTAKKKHVRRLRLCHIRSNVFGSEVPFGDPYLGFGVKKPWNNSTKIMDMWIYEDLHLDSFGFIFPFDV